MKSTSTIAYLILVTEEPASTATTPSPANATLVSPAISAKHKSMNVSRIPASTADFAKIASEATDAVV